MSAFKSQAAGTHLVCFPGIGKGVDPVSGLSDGGDDTLLQHLIEFLPYQEVHGNWTSMWVRTIGCTSLWIVIWYVPGKYPITSKVVWNSHLMYSFMQIGILFTPMVGCFIGLVIGMVTLALVLYRTLTMWFIWTIHNFAQLGESHDGRTWGICNVSLGVGMVCDALTISGHPLVGLSWAATLLWVCHCR